MLRRVAAVGMTLLSLVVVVASCGKAPQAVTIEHEYDVASTCSEITLSAHQDVGDKPFLYVTAKEGGLRVYDISGGAGANLVATLPSSQFGGLHTMNLSQTGSLLFVALGNTFGTAIQTTGMAIVDVANPATPTLRALWQDASLKGGTGIAVSDGAFAYLGAMGNGIIIFDVKDPANPREVSRLRPALDFPDAKYDDAKINARGMEVVGNTLYLCYDAGGFRIIDVTDRAAPRETGRYSNPALNGRPRAYNNVVIDGTSAYLGFDYCGVEVLDIADPANIKPKSWWNPWRCEVNPLNWFSSAGHANEVALDRANHLLFVSSGKSDLVVLDVSDPSAPGRSAEYGGVDNGLGSWGVSIHGNQVFVTYTCALVPFTSTWSGVKALKYRK